MIKCLECPNCGSDDVYVTQYDFGRDRETGYSDSGERGHCRKCGDEGDIGDYEVMRPEEPPDDPDAWSGGFADNHIAEEGESAAKELVVLGAVGRPVSGFRDINHASDCANWVGEPCNCDTGKRAL